MRVSDAGAAVDAILARTDGRVRLGLPLGLGKPVTLVNALTERACADAGIELSIFTALTLERPVPGSEMERRFLEPALDRLFGAYPELLYAKLLREDRLPANVEVNEFFLMAGRWLGAPAMQRRYISANYTHALHVLLDQRPNVLVQLMPEEDSVFSLSCNADISSDLFRLRREGRIDFVAAAEVHPDLPFLGGPGTLIDGGEIDVVLDPPAPAFELFSAVRRPVSDAAHAIGLHVAGRVPDGGTLQVGIGSIGDAVAHALLLRHRGASEAIRAACPFPTDGTDTPFEMGLYAATEMLVGGLLELFEAGVIQREVEGHAIEAAFFVESRDVYRRLREMPEAQRAKIAMRPVSYTNQLYGDEAAKRAARTGARFINGAMQVSCLGDVTSDAKADGQVVSGVGGQFNFVEQAFALRDASSIITLPATRETGGKTVSNIRWDVEAVTVPRHMRDVVVTEYGVADLRGQPDAEVAARMVAIADSRFQDDLIAQARKAGKLAPNFTLPEAARHNTPVRLRAWLDPHRAHLPTFPFGTDFDAAEQMLIPALERLANDAAHWSGRVRLLRDAVTLPAHPREREAMTRMGFAQGGGLQALALRGALRRAAKA
ncbi:MAG: acetyl-CoA hydrolase/transferase C-terminal domain-containing protein [Shimia sp.]